MWAGLRARTMAIFCGLARPHGEGLSWRALAAASHWADTEFKLQTRESP